MNKIFLSLIISAFALSLQARETKPLPDSAYNKYPYSTVGVVENSDGWRGSGSAVGPRTVLTAAHVFYDADFSRWTTQPYTWSWKRNPRTTTQPGNEARSFVFFEDYASLVDDQSSGRSSLEAFDKDVYILQFLADIITGSAATVAVNQMGAESYKMVVGYPAALYDFYDYRINRMHATGRGEPANRLFSLEQVQGEAQQPLRAYAGNNLKTAGGNSGGPIFGFIDNKWQQIGILVGGLGLFGNATAVGIDDIVAAMINGTTEGPSTVKANSIYNASIDDVNRTLIDAETVSPERSEIGSIFPSGDIDYYRVDIATGNNQNTLYFLNRTGVALYLEMLSTSGEVLLDLSVENGQIANVDFSLPGTFYARISNTSGQTADGYTLSLLDRSRDLSGDADFGLGVFVPIDLNLNTTVTASLSRDVAADYFRFVVTEPGRFFARFRSEFDLFARLLVPNEGATFPLAQDAIQFLIDFDDDSGAGFNPFLEADLPAGTYYIELIGSEGVAVGNYELQNWFIPDLLGPVVENLNVDDFFKLADFTRYNKVYNEAIDSGGEIDIRRITVGSPGIVTIASSGTTDTYAVLYNEDFVPIADDQNSGEGENFSISQLLDNGTYYVRIKGTDDATIGDYTVAATFERNPTFWQGYTGAADGQKTLPWFGTFTSPSEASGTITHDELGEVFIMGLNYSKFYINFSESDLWFETSDTLYPTLIELNSGTRYRHVAGTQNPRRFLDVETNISREESELIPSSFN